MIFTVEGKIRFFRSYPSIGNMVTLHDTEIINFVSHRARVL